MRKILKFNLISFKNLENQISLMNIMANSFVIYSMYTNIISKYYFSICTL